MDIDDYFDSWTTGEFFESSYPETFSCKQCDELQCVEAYGVVYVHELDECFCSEECYEKYLEENKDDDTFVMSLRCS